MCKDPLVFRFSVRNVCVFELPGAKASHEKSLFVRCPLVLLVI
jgi:hypothetical protein